MKLYTEEEVKRAIKFAQKCDQFLGDFYFEYTEDEVIQDMTPIELPSDKEIEKEASVKFGILKSNKAFIGGAKWMRDKLQGGNK